jgi:hypothetical protein
MILSFIQKIVAFSLWAVLFVVTALLVLLMWNGIHNRYVEGDSAGWATLIMPFLALVPIAVTIPFILKAFHVMLRDGMSVSFLVFASLSVFVYLIFIFNLFKIYSLSWQESLTIPCLLLWVTGTFIVGLSFYGLRGGQHLVPIFFVVGTLLAPFILVPMIRINKEISRSDQVAVMAYDTPFYLTEYRRYEFPDFTLVPDLSVKGYSVIKPGIEDIRYGTGDILGMLFVPQVVDGKLFTRFTGEQSYTNLEVVQGAIDGKYYKIYPHDNGMVVLKEGE